MRIGYWNELRPGEDWRNVLSAYEIVVYELGRDPVTQPMREALVAWPGIIVLHGVDLDGLLARALDRAVAVVVDSAALAERLRAEFPWTEIVVADRARDFAELASSQKPLRVWLEPLLEAAAAEIPGFFPGDRAAPWRAEVEELVTLRQTGANVRQSTKGSAR